MIEPFLRNYWYICAWREELTQQPLQRWILNEPIALFRTASGKVAALADRCPHRGAPLTTGQVRGEGLECGYHGLTFDSAGTCMRVPGRDSVPGAFSTRAYPAVEKWRFVYIWMGDPALADESLIPDWRWCDDPQWSARGETLPVNCHATLLRDNLLDLSHAHFVHARTLATDAVISAPIQVEESDNTVIVRRNMDGIAPSPFFRRILGGFDGKVNHHQLIRFEPPASIVIELTVWDPANIECRANLRVMNFLTPATDRTSLYFWSLARNMSLQDDALDDWIFKANRNTFFEDVDVIEKQQDLLERAPAPVRQLLFHVDGGVNAGRKLVARLLEDEAARINAAAQ
jgi:phenylpropionate dioxygenase-like ring-hydroxylating dioxygenase large terminal subunit